MPQIDTNQSNKKTKKDLTDRKKSPVTEEKTDTFSEFFRITESYTSLILGIVVVVIATILLVAFFKNQHTAHVTKPSQQISYDKIGPTNTVEKKVSITPSTKPTEKITQSIKPTQSVQKISPSQNKNMKVQAGAYTVKAGDDLWDIALQHYNSGEEWVSIAKANKLAIPNDIHIGDKLTLPAQTSEKQTAMQVQKTSSEMNTQSISAKTYTVMHGDNLWQIAVRAYGDGYRWVNIAKANNLVNPNLIFSGNVFTIPR